MRTLSAATKNIVYIFTCITSVFFLFCRLLPYTAGVKEYSVAPEWRVNKDEGRHLENKGIIVSSEHSFRILVGNFKTGGDVYLPFPKKTLGTSYSFGSLPQYLN